jgi:hypothetical protein
MIHKHETLAACYYLQETKAKFNEEDGSKYLVV